MYLGAPAHSRRQRESEAVVKQRTSPERVLFAERKRNCGFIHSASVKVRARLTGKLTLLKHKKRENHRSSPPLRVSKGNRTPLVVILILFHTLDYSHKIQ